MDKQTMAPYIFDACYSANDTGVSAPDSFMGMKLEYARAYVVPQAYTNISTPDVALARGTMFDDLYMPYRMPRTFCGCANPMRTED